MTIEIVNACILFEKHSDTFLPDVGEGAYFQTRDRQQSAYKSILNFSWASLDY